MDEPSDPGAGYRYVGVPLLPSMIEELTLELFAGQTPKRIEIATATAREHVRRGGLPSPADPVSQVKKALSRMTEKGWAIPRGFGRYEIVGPAGTNPAPAAPLTVRAAPADEPPAREVGVGAGSVYVYYSPRDRQLAELAGAPRWRCKVGRTAGAAEARIRGQSGTALSERPHIDLVIRTDDPRSVEVALHAVLTLKGRLLADAPGREWFLTSPAEVEAIYETLTRQWN